MRCQSNVLPIAGLMTLWHWYFVGFPMSTVVVSFIVFVYGSRPSLPLFSWYLLLIHYYALSFTYCNVWGLLVVPRHRLSSNGRRAFSVAGFAIWNWLSDMSDCSLERSGRQQRLLQAFTEDVFIFSLLVYIAH